MAHILITGATGLIGRSLTKHLLGEGHAVSYYTRDIKSTSRFMSDQAHAYIWAPERGKIDLTPLRQVDAIIHLAGAGIADKRWTQRRKQELVESRIETADLLLRHLKVMPHQVKSVISASAIGYYGLNTGSRTLTEESEAGMDFPARLVQSWERKMQEFSALGIRSVQLRTGIVLSGQGGALPKLVRPVKYGIGSPLGRGTQMQSWIHIDDITRLYAQAVKDENWHGAYNAVAPQPVTNIEMTRQIAVLLKRPLWLPPVPIKILRILLGEVADLIVSDNLVVNERIARETNFKYQFRDLRSALHDLIATPT